MCVCRVWGNGERDVFVSGCESEWYVKWAWRPVHHLRTTSVQTLLPVTVFVNGRRVVVWRVPHSRLLSAPPPYFPSSLTLPPCSPFSAISSNLFHLALSYASSSLRYEKVSWVRERMVQEEGRLWRRVLFAEEPIKSNS
ncbi:hypothetical protein E2C01_056908 [Portunus trituberculatus]|uniref:Uncharacterized protein n=1 Tax=Portunus trituberculatus TaxID=210409 RepID=A0A5B7H0E7_PORTR|nr:hypothetical protein [Portunus trituberculatus]